MNEQVKRKRGRPAGGVSFSNITLEELNRRFKPNDSILVGRLFLEKEIKNKVIRQASEITGKTIKETTKSINEIHDAFSAPTDSTVEMTLQA